MDSMVYHIGCCVQQSALSTVDDFAFIIDKDEIGRLDQAESNTEWVDPKCCRIYRVPQRDVTSHTFVKAIFAKDAEGSRKSALQICALFVRIVKLWRLGEFKHLRLSIFLVQTRLVRGNRVGLGLVACLGLNCRRRRHVCDS